MTTTNQAMSDGRFEIGATYLVLRTDGDWWEGSVAAGELLVFWRHTYSFYDGIDFYVFTTPDDFYGPPRDDIQGRRTVSWALPHDKRGTDAAVWLEHVEPPRPGPMWMVDWWVRKMAEMGVEVIP
ncbi:MAG TPA: hypothetical protein VEA69_11465 [Tepidisphaeraceae bacterium]|nr:hypothetical protein [Tepidisphaeraceae bacterium]